MANTDKNIIITPNIGSSTADPNIVFTGGNTTVANSINMTMYASGTLSWDGTAGQLFSITNSLTGTIFSVNDISGIPSITVNSLGNIVLAQYSGNVTVGAAQGQSGNVLSVAGNIYTFGNSYVAQNQYVTGNIVAYGSNDLFGGKVGIGTTSTAGANSNVLSVYGTAMIYGNIDLSDTSNGSSGIYFADGTLQTTAAKPAGNNTEIQFNNSGAFGASSSLTWTGTTLNATLLKSTQSSGDEGGQLDLAVAQSNTTILGSVAIDIFRDRLRFFETGGTNRGYYLDISTGAAAAATNLLAAASGNYSNLNVASYLSGPVVVGNLTINNTTASTSTLTGALLMGGGAGIQGAVHIGGLIYGASTLNIAGAAQVNSLTSNGAISGTTGTFTAALYGASFNTAGTATVNALVSNGAVSGTTGTFTGALYGGSFNTAGTATVNALVSNGAITGTTGTFTSIQNSGTTTTNALVSNVYGLFGQNVTVNSTNASTSTTTGALKVAGGAGLGGALHVSGLIYGASTLNIAGAAQVNSLISNGAITGSTINGTAGTFTSLQSSGAATVNTLVSNGAITGTTTTVTSLQSSGTATVNALVSNGAVSGTTGTFTGALYGGSFNTAGTATVNALVSNTDVKTATVNASSTIVGANLYSNGFVQAIGTVTAGTITSNGTVTAGTGLTVTTGGMTVTGTSSFTGNVNITGNVNVTGAINSTSSNILVVQDPLIYVGQNNPGDLYDLGIVGAYTEGSYYNTGIVRNHNDNFWTVFDTLTSAPNVITGNVDWSDSTITYGPFKAGNIVVMGNTASTGTTTGALIINGVGGVGVGGRLNVGGSAWFAGTVNAGGTAIVNALTSNGAVSGTAGTFTGALYGASFNTAGTATVNALVSNGAITATTITGTAGTFTSIQNSGQTLTNSLVANVFARFGQNVEIDSSNASTSSSNGALQVAGGVGITGNINVGGSNNLFTNKVGIGTSDVLGARANVLAVYGSENIFGNLIVANTAAGGSGIYFPDGTFQQTASAVGGVNQSVQFNDNGIFGGQTNFIYDKTNVRLGIGTTNLTNSLMVYSATPALFNTTNGADQQVIIGNTTAYGTVLGFNSSTGTGVNTYGYLSAVGAAAKNISVTTTGTGIGGVTIPQNTLEVGGTTIIGASYSGNNNFINPPSSGLAVQGSVGVGTFTPISKLDVRGGGAFTGAVNIGGAASVASLVSNGAVSGTTGTFTSALYSASFNTAGTATVNALVSNGAISGTTITGTAGTFTSLQSSGTATVNVLVSNGAVSGTTGTFTGALYGGSLNSAGTATVNALVSNGTISGTTITGTAGTFTSLQVSGTTTTNALVSNVYARFGQNVEIDSTNVSISTTTGALQVAGGVGIVGNINVGGATNYFAGNIGISNSAPIYKLQINNAATVGTTASILANALPIAYIDNGNYAGGSIVIKTHNPGNDNQVGAIKFAASPDGNNYSWAGVAGIADTNSAASGLAFYTANGNTQGTAAGASSERVRININGYVGIATTTPGSVLDVNGVASIRSAMSVAGTATVNALTSNGAITGTTVNGTAGTFTSLQVSGTTTTNALVSNVYGLFGQNVTVNSTNASISTTTGAIITPGGIGVGGNINVGGAINTFTGNVGIGISAPISKLHTYQTITSTLVSSAILGAAYSAGNLSHGLGLSINNNPVSAGMYVTDANGAGANLIFATAANYTTPTNTERMRISSAGNVMIGTNVTTPAGLAVVSNINNSTYPLQTLDAAAITIRNDSVAGLNLSAKLNFNVATVGSSVISGYYAAFNGSNDIGTGLILGTQLNAAGGTVERMRIDQTGNVGIINSVSVGGYAVASVVNSNSTIQAADTITANVLKSNVYGFFGQNVTVNSTNASTSTATGALTVAGGAGIAGNLNVGGNVVAAGFNYSNGQGPGYTSVLDDISIYFDGVKQTFNLTVDGSTVSPKNPNLLQVWIGGVNVYPAQYVTDVQNLPVIPTFTRGFVVYNNTIIFATAPQPYMDFYGTVRTNNDVMPTFTYKQSQFSAINIMMGY